MENSRTAFTPRARTLKLNESWIVGEHSLVVYHEMFDFSVERFQWLLAWQEIVDEREVSAAWLNDDLRRFCQEQRMDSESTTKHILHVQFAAEK